MSVAKLAGHTVTSGVVTLPDWGRWFADISVDGEHALNGLVEVTLADMSLKGTVLSGGPTKGRSFFRIVGGFGGWGQTLKARSYNSDAGVRLATVLSDAASSVGEQLDATTIDRTARTGPAFVRPEGPAAAVLEMLCPEAWYVGEDGVTRLGRRPRQVLTTQAPRVEPLDAARGKLTLASESLVGLVPGAVVDGLEAIDVQHELSPTGLRTTLWGKRTGASRRLAAFRAIFEQLDPDRAFRGLSEYRVVTQEGERLNLQPIRVSSGMPSLKRVQVMAGIPGAKANVALGSRVLVAFVDASPGRPVVTHFEDPEGSGWKPLVLNIDGTLVKIGQGALPAARAGDLAGGIWPIATTQTGVLL